MGDPCNSQVLVETKINKTEGNHKMVVCNLPVVKPRHKSLTSPIVSSKDIAKELIERAEKRHKSYPDGMDVLLAMKTPSPVKQGRKEEGKLDACELLSILQDGAELHYVDKPKPKTPRLSRGQYKDLKIDPELEKRLALQQLMEFSKKRGRPKKSESEKNNNKPSGGSEAKRPKKINNNNEKTKKKENSNKKGVINESSLPSDNSTCIEPVIKKDVTIDNNGSKDNRKTPNRELMSLLQDEGAINMLYSIKGETDSKEKLLPSKRRMKKAFLRRAQEVTEALLGGPTTSGLSLRHRGIIEKRKPSTESVDSEHSEFNFIPPADSKIIRRHSSSSSYSSRASSPRIASPPPMSLEEGGRISQRAEQMIEAKCKELNLQPEHSQIIKKLIQEKHNGLKERLQSEFANKLKAAISRSEGLPVSSPEKAAIWKMVEEDWGSSSDHEGDSPIENGKGLRTEVKLERKTKKPANSPNITGAYIVERKNDDKRLPHEISPYREIQLELIDGLACLSLATKSTVLPYSLSTKVLRELSLALEHVSQSSDVKCITLSSEGVDFCLGFDLPGLLCSDPMERRSLAAQAALAIKEFACKVCMLGKPLIAGVRGRSVGLGAVLLAYCDMVVAEPDATFTTPYPRLGCFPEAAATTLFPHVIGLAQTKKLLLACSKLSTVEAEACGLVTKVVPAGGLKAHLYALGADVLTHSHQVMASTKAVVMHGLRTKLPSVLETEVKLLQQHWNSEDCQRRIAHLREHPNF